jgi:hypothetical protein
MPYPYSIVSRVDGETITHTKYNADHQNHVDHNIPEDADDYSANVTEMRVQTSPGGVGSESLATNLAGELERLRYAIAALNGTAYWYQPTGSTSAVKGLLGANNATTPTTQYDLSAHTIAAASLTKKPAYDVNNTVFTVDITQTGPVLNGRDQAGVFSANSYVHLYYITDGTTPGLIASTVGPSAFAGPALPSGYTHWAYLTTLRLNASTEFLRTRTCNGWVYYEIDDGGVTRIVNNGAATTFTNVDLGPLVPQSISREVLLNCRLNFVHNATAAFGLFLRPASATYMTAGIVVAAASAQVTGVTVASANWVKWLTTNASLDYKLSAAPATSGGAIIEVVGYHVPNGAE